MRVSLSKAKIGGWEKVVKIQAVIFDLDGVIVTTDDCHYNAWKKMADEEGIFFDRSVNERLRGVSRMESLEIILEKATKVYTYAEKEALATRKNNYYVEYIKKLTPEAILPGVMVNLEALKDAGVKIAIGSSSKNAPMILKQIGLDKTFDAVADGNQIKNSKPDPEVFLKAAELLGIEPKKCLVVEDADAGIIAAKKVDMSTLAVKNAQGGDYHCDGLDEVKLVDLLD